MTSVIPSIIPRARLNVLLVEDNRDDAELIEELLQVEYNGFPSFNLTNVLRLSEALETLKKDFFDVILLDLSLPDSQGFATLKALQAKRVNLPIVVVTASQDEELGIQLIKAGAQDFLTKRKIDSQILIRTLRYAIERQNLQNALQQREADYRAVAQKIRHEIVERQQVEEALRISEERFRSLVGNIPGAIYRCQCDADWTMELIGDEIETISGYPASDFIQNRCLTFANIIHPEDVNQVECGVLDAVAARRSYNLEYRIVRKDGSLRWVYEKGRAIYSQEGEVLWLDGVIFDISDRKAIEEALQQQILRERLVGTIFERIRSSLNLEEVLKTAVEEVRVFLHTDQTMIYHFNPQGRPLIAVESVGEGCQPILGSNLAIPILQGGRLWGLLVAHHCSSSRQWQEFEVESLNQISIQLAIAIQQSILFEQAQTEIAERKQAEAALKQSEARERSKALQLEDALNQLRNTQAQLVQTEKMAGLGQLVAGIAHEINNPVNFIFGNITPASEYAQNLLQLINLYQKHYPIPKQEIADEIAILDLDFLKEDFQKLLFSMKEGAQRIKDIVLSLRNFSRLDEAEMKEADLHSGIESTLLILQHRLKKQPNRPAIQVLKELGNLPFIECYPGQLNQVLMNILTNAIDALEDKCKTDSAFMPTIRIATAVQGREDSNLESVIIRIADNGCGIPLHVQKRIFDPFFTTKPVGKGTGLGLSISYQIIVEKHQGTLQCNSQPGQGTEFTIELNRRQFENQRSINL